VNICGKLYSSFTPEQTDNYFNTLIVRQRYYEYNDQVAGVIRCTSILSSVVVTIDRVSDWMIGFIDTLYIQFGTTGNCSATAISTLYSSPLHT
jgi:hypothetical protein